LDFGLRTSDFFPFKRFGLVLVESNTLPIHLVNPAAMPEGKNLVVLKGAGRPDLPARVEVPVGFRAAKIHLLGCLAAVAADVSRRSHSEAPAAKVVLHYADGQTEETLLNQGEHLSDHAQPAELTGARPVAGLLESGQLCLITLEPRSRAPIARLAFESAGHPLAPVFVAVTLQE